MSFFQDVEQTKTFTSGGFQPLIPADTKLLCTIVGASWEPATQFRNEIVQVLLMVTQSGPYNSFVVKDNIKVMDKEPKKANKAKTKLFVYDAIGKGLLAKSDAAGKDIVNDTLLLEKSLCGQSVLVTFDVWELEGNDGEMRSGNWVKSIEASGEDKKIIEKAKELPVDDEYVGDIPF